MSICLSVCFQIATAISVTEFLLFFVGICHINSHGLGGSDEPWFWCIFSWNRELNEAQNIFKTYRASVSSKWPTFKALQEVSQGHMEEPVACKLPDKFVACKFQVQCHIFCVQKDWLKAEIRAENRWEYVGNRMLVNFFQETLLFIVLGGSLIFVWACLHLKTYS